MKALKSICEKILSNSKVINIFFWIFFSITNEYEKESVSDFSFFCLCRKFDEAMQVISEHGGKYSLVSVARLYLDHLLEQKNYDEAAKLCQTTFGNDKVLWEEEVFKFVKVQKLRLEFFKFTNLYYSQQYINLKLCIIPVVSHSQKFRIFFSFNQYKIFTRNLF